MTRCGFAPEPVQQPRDDPVLLGLGSAGQRDPRHAPLKEQSDGVVELLPGVEPDGTVPIPLTQSVSLVRRFRVSTFNLQHQLGPGIVHDWSHPGCLTTRLEGLTNR